MLNWLGTGVKVNSGAKWFNLCKLQRVKWFPQYLFSFLLFSVPLFFFFFLMVFFIEFSQPPERGSICWYWLVKCFLLVQQLFFLQYNFNKIGTKRLQYILFFCFYKSKFHIVILFSLYKLIYLIRHLCLRLKYSLLSPLTRATRIRGGGHVWYVPFPPVVQAGRASTVRLWTNTDTRTVICVACLNTEKTD